MPGIAANIEFLRSQVPASVRIVAVSKTRPPEEIAEAYNTGQRIFGENRVQELLRKKDLLPHDIQWHLIGHLQTNKVKSIVSFISLIQSVDSSRLLSVINSESAKAGKITDCLLQLHIAQEDTKTGFLMDEVSEMLKSSEFTDFRNVAVRGVMGMATYTSDMQQVRDEFRYLSECFSILKQNFFSNDPGFSEISMGMSGDYLIAVEEGSTIIRVGSLIFGERKPK